MLLHLLGLLLLRLFLLGLLGVGRLLLRGAQAGGEAFGLLLFHLHGGLLLALLLLGLLLSLLLRLLLLGLLGGGRKIVGLEEAVAGRGRGRRQHGRAEQAQRCDESGDLFHGLSFRMYVRESERENGNAGLAFGPLGA